MNPAALIKENVSLLRRYTQIFLVHVFLLYWLSAHVLDVSILSGQNTLWALLKYKIETSVSAVGLSLDVWYVLAALVLAYLEAFAWLRSFLTTLPLLRISAFKQYRPELLARAGEVLKINPEDGLYTVRNRLDDLIDTYDKEIQESGKPHPYRWQFDRNSNWYKLHGTLLVVLSGAAIWAFEGGTLARSSGAIWNLVLLLSGAMLLTRWRLHRLYAYTQDQLGHWALREYERRQVEVPEDPLGWARHKRLLRQAQFEEDLRMHPLEMLKSRSWRMPKKMGDWIYEFVDARWKPPRWEAAFDLFLRASANVRYADEVHTPPVALRVEDQLVRQFASLLECKGAGICKLVSYETGLAPAVDYGGSRYSFAERKHGWGLLSLSLEPYGSNGDFYLTVSSRDDNKCLLADVGPHPIELLAQRLFPSDGKPWYRLARENFDEALWPPNRRNASTDLAGITLATQLPMKTGSSYLMRARTVHGTQAVVAFQCYRVQGSQPLVIAWRILDIYPYDAPIEEEKIPRVHKWWAPQAWREVVAALFRKPERGGEI